MQLTPHYGPDPVISLDGTPSAIAEPMIRQRQRLASTLTGFTADQWAHPSRCDGWSTRDVIVHLSSVNQFWTYSVHQGVAGEPTQLLATFDPVADPAKLVAGADDVSTESVLTQFIETNEALAGLLTSLNDDAWLAQAEAPPGHMTISALAHHSLWDGWVHERDIMLPLGLEPEVQDDEVIASLRYVAALGPGLSLGERTGTLGVTTTGPDSAFTIHIGDQIEVRSDSDATDLTIRGSAVELLEQLSIRTPFTLDVPPEHAWMVAGLSTAFEAQR